MLRQAAESAPGRRLVESVLRGRRVDPRIEPDAHEAPEEPSIGALDELVLAEQLAHLTGAAGSSPPPPSHERSRPPLRRSASGAIMPPPRGASSAPAPASAGAGAQRRPAPPSPAGVVVPAPASQRESGGKGTLPFGALDLDLDELGGTAAHPRSTVDPPASADSRVRNKERQAEASDQWLEDHTTRQLRLGR